MNVKTTVFPVNSTNFSLIASGKKTKYYRNIVTSYTELFNRMFNIELTSDFKLSRSGVVIEQTEARKIRFCLSTGTKGQPTLVAMAHLSVEYGEKAQGGNPDILYYVLTIEKLLEEI